MTGNILQDLCKWHIGNARGLAGQQSITLDQTALVSHLKFPFTLEKSIYIISGSGHTKDDISPAFLLMNAYSTKRKSRMQKPLHVTKGIVYV